MRLAIFGDIHGNLAALEAVIQDMDEQGIQSRLCLGDIAFRGPQPQETLARVRDMDLAAVVVGNTDQWLFQGFPDSLDAPADVTEQLSTYRAWALERLDDASLDWLRALPMQQAVKAGNHTVGVVHASPGSTEAWFAPSASDDALTPIFQGAIPCDILVYGHVHVPFIRRINRRWLGNAGSVGLSKDGDARASYLVVDATGEDLQLSIRRVAYAIDATAAEAAARDFPFAEAYVQGIKTGT